MTTANPVISNIFEIFAPIIFPDNISEDCLLTEIIPEMSSGKEVPIPTIKTPITKVGNPKNLPIVSADFVKNLAESKSANSASMKIK
jgi:hypothetical protein